MDLTDLVETIHDREDFVSFVDALLHNYKVEPSRWENADLPSFLEALVAWARDMDGYYQHRGELMQEQPSWKIFGQMLMAATTYE